MMKKMIRRKKWFLMAFSFCAFAFSFCVNAQDIKGIQIIPELEGDDLTQVQEAIDEIGKTWWQVMDTYREKAANLTTEQQLASWIMDWDTIVNYLVYVVKFLSQLWLVVWVVFIMYAWYKYMVSVFTGWKTPTSTIKNAIIWVIIVIFSYAIMRILTSLVGLS